MVLEKLGTKIGINGFLLVDVESEDIAENVFSVLQSIFESKNVTITEILNKAQGDCILTVSLQCKGRLR